MTVEPQNKPSYEEAGCYLTSHETRWIFLSMSKKMGVIRHSERFYGTPVRTSGKMCVPSDILRNSMVSLWGIHGKFGNILYPARLQNS
ncbi:hypothetical protein CEXT_546141 [Caerostris extrusa]|uniref:Uncharacterized protein n=1 Tax=Caerostris extrusa TaxID=172846 RepID=A0AAV4S2B0_CAEEX|nr:hypothetical protein CEXT_546141 [Caerostris extrusa]